MAGKGKRLQRAAEATIDRDKALSAGRGGERG